MQQAVFKLYRDINVEYTFRNRGKQKYSKEAYDLLTTRINQLDSLALTQSELDYLTSLTYFSADYLSYLSSFRFNANHVNAQFNNQTLDLSIKISGKWIDTILYEVPLLALVSQCYFETIDTDWDYHGQQELARNKCTTLLNNNCSFSEFGTRRRRSFKTQEIVVTEFINTAIKSPAKSCFLGTSNVYLAYKLGTTPIGTVAHEWFMAVSVLENDLKHANRNAIKKWLEAYPDSFHVALTDTYGSTTFFNDLDFNHATVLSGIRQDSGDPLKFVDQALEKYTELGIDPTTKLIVFSDSLDVQKCIDINNYCKTHGGFKACFGVGTHFTNDFIAKSSQGKVKSKALNIVIKLTACAGKPVVKLSDDIGKHQGDPEAVKHALQVFGMSSSS
jgi:nicotinate phosphoribosyltransferase